MGFDESFQGKTIAELRALLSDSGVSLSSNPISKSTLIRLCKQNIEKIRQHQKNLQDILESTSKTTPSPHSLRNKSPAAEKKSSNKKAKSPSFPRFKPRPWKHHSPGFRVMRRSLSSFPQEETLIPSSPTNPSQSHFSADMEIDELLTSSLEDDDIISPARNLVMLQSDSSGRDGFENNNKEPLNVSHSPISANTPPNTAFLRSSFAEFFESSDQSSITSKLQLPTPFKQADPIDQHHPTYPIVGPPSPQPQPPLPDPSSTFENRIHAGSIASGFQTPVRKIGLRAIGDSYPRTGEHHPSLLYTPDQQQQQQQQQQHQHQHQQHQHQQNSPFSTPTSTQRRRHVVTNAPKGPRAPPPALLKHKSKIFTIFLLACLICGITFVSPSFSHKVFCRNGATPEEIKVEGCTVCPDYAICRKGSSRFDCSPGMSPSKDFSKCVSGEVESHFAYEFLMDVLIPELQRRKGEVICSYGAAAYFTDAELRMLLKYEIHRSKNEFSFDKVLAKLQPHIVQEKSVSVVEGDRKNIPRSYHTTRDPYFPLLCIWPRVGHLFSWFNTLCLIIFLALVYYIQMMLLSRSLSSNIISTLQTNRNPMPVDNFRSNVRSQTPLIYRPASDRLWKKVEGRLRKHPDFQETMQNRNGANIRVWELNKVDKSE